VFEVLTPITFDLVNLADSRLIERSFWKKWYVTPTLRKEVFVGKLSGTFEVLKTPGLILNIILRLTTWCIFESDFRIHRND